MKNKINVLGTDYEIFVRQDDEDPKLSECLGYCEQYSKKIVLSDMKTVENDILCVENIDELKKKICRHEIIHAFLGESGLRSSSDWAENEEMVDWFAIQIPKINKAFEELGI